LVASSFAPGQKERVQGYFAIYYFTVNIGSAAEHDHHAQG
jgi:hypothetical protein